MSTESFHRHTRRCVDAAARRVFLFLHTNPRSRAAFAELMDVVRAKSDLLRTPPERDGRVVSIEALRNLARAHVFYLRAPSAWPGACGHPLAVVHALADHLLMRYPTPRFLAQVWFGGDDADGRRRRAIHLGLGRGLAMRELAMPYAVTGRIEAAFRRTPDHVALVPALRRAEVLGLGGSEALAGAVLETHLAHDFEHAAFWRAAIVWLVRRADGIAAARVRAIVEFLRGAVVEGPDADRWLRGRPLASVERDALAWHGTGGWRRSRWRELAWEAEASAEWSIVELCDGAALRREGRRMHNCVASYVPRCARGRSSIWSMRRRAGGDAARSVLTIEIDPRRATIVQVRAPRNAAAPGDARAVLERWAAREQLAVASSAF